MALLEYVDTCTFADGRTQLVCAYLCEHCDDYAAFIIIGLL